VTDERRAELGRHAYAVADEYRDGKLPHISKSWDATRASLCKELERRCPGWTEHEYQDALSQGFHESR
jgi:hypothetical protein